MLPMKAIRLSLGEALAASVAIWTTAGLCVVRLIAAPFTPGENLVTADLTFATFSGSASLVCQNAPQEAGVDPATQEQKVTIIAPLGGWRWECSATPGSPETVYGYALVDDGGVLLGVALLNNPVTIAAIGDFLDLGSIEITFVLRPMS